MGESWYIVDAIEIAHRTKWNGFSKNIYLEANQMEREIEYLAIVQQNGMETDNAVVSRGFAKRLDAVRWVRGIVEEAYGEFALVVPHFTKLTYDTGGYPQNYTRWMWTVVTVGGPMWGMVIDLAGAQFPAENTNE